MNKGISYFLKLMLLNISLFLTIKFFEKDDDRLYIEKYLDTYTKTKTEGSHTGWMKNDAYKGTFETIESPNEDKVNDAYNYAVKFPRR
jgi:hypothetical protein